MRKLTIVAVVAAAIVPASSAQAKQNQKLSIATAAGEAAKFVGARDASEYGIGWRVEYSRVTRCERKGHAIVDCNYRVRVGSQDRPSSNCYGTVRVHEFSEASVVTRSYGRRMVCAVRAKIVTPSSGPVGAWPYMR